MIVSRKLAALLIVIALPVIAVADDVETRLASIREGIASQQVRVDAARSRERDLLKIIQEEQKSLAGLRKKREVLRAQEGALRSEFLAIEKSVTEAVRRVDEQRTRSATRLYAMMKALRRQSSSMLFSSTTALSGAAVRATELRRVREYDRSLFDTLRRSEGEAKALQEQARVALESHQQKKSELLEAERGVSQSLKNLELSRKRLEGERRLLSEQLVRLRSEALRLESLISTITSGIDEESITTGSPSPLAVSSGTREYQGSGLSKVGRLPLPVKKGKPSGNYDVRTGQLKFIAIPGGEVVSVAKGQVVFSRELPLYGKTVIIDHGSRYHSVYSGLEVLAVSEKAIVLGGERLGRLPTTEGATTLLFGIRKSGAIVDPRPFFASKAR